MTIYLGGGGYKNALKSVDLYGEGLEGSVGTVVGSVVEGEGPEGSVGTVVGAVVEGEGPEGSVGTVVGTVVEGKAQRALWYYY